MICRYCFRNKYGDCANCSVLDETIKYLEDKIAFYGDWGKELGIKTDMQNTRDFLEICLKKHKELELKKTGEKINRFAEIYDRLLKLVY